MKRINNQNMFIEEPDLDLKPKSVKEKDYFFNVNTFFNFNFNSLSLLSCSNCMFSFNKFVFTLYCLCLPLFRRHFGFDLNNLDAILDLTSVDPPI